MEDHSTAILNFQRRRTRLRVTVTVIAIGYALTLAVIGTAACTPNRRKPVQDLTLRSISIVDDAGIVRVRLGAPLPDPISNGREGKRDEPISGILIYDSTGANVEVTPPTTQKGGGGNALLTLDSKDDQVVTLVAYPRRGAEAGVQRSRGNAVALRSLEGGSEIVVLNNGRVSFRQPQ